MAHADQARQPLEHTVDACSQELQADAVAGSVTTSSVFHDVGNEGNEDMNCRICLESDKVDSLFCPCRCQGSQRFVHRCCLEHWRMHADNAAAYYKCGTCLYEYSLHRVRVADFLDTPMLPIVCTVPIVCSCTALASRLAMHLFEHLLFPRLQWLQSIIIGMAMQGLVVLTVGGLINDPLCLINCLCGTIHLLFDQFWNYPETWTPGCIIGCLLELAMRLGLHVFPVVAEVPFMLIRRFCRTYLRKLSLRVLGVEAVRDVRATDPHSNTDHVGGITRPMVTRRCVVAVVLVGALMTATLYPSLLMQDELTVAMRQDILQLSSLDFDAVVGQSRERVSSVWFFKKGSKADNAFVEVYHNVVNVLGDMVTLAAVECNKWSNAFRDEKGVEKPPALVIFPTGSAPPLLHQGKMDVKAIANHISKFIPDKTTQLHSKAAVDSFLGTDRAMRKVLLFSSKNAPPTMLKSLSSDGVLKHTVKFGFVSETNAKVVQRFKVQRFPTIIMLAEEREEYKGETTFTAIKEWLTSRG